MLQTYDWEKIFFENIRPRNNGCVVFGDGSKDRVQGIGNVGRNASPMLEKVFLVKGLVSNLISISQLCDQGLEVKFNKTECLVTNQEGVVLMRGIRSENNFYKWVPYQMDQSLERARMLIKRLEHQKILKIHDHSHFGNSNNWRRTFSEENHINAQGHSLRNPVDKKITSTEDPLLDKCTEFVKKFEKLRDKLDISLQKKL